MTPTMYRASDDDLPAIFCPNEERYRRAIESELRATQEELDQRKHYVRRKKIEEMFEWIVALMAEEKKLSLEPYEHRFLNDLFDRFVRWYPKVKWVTQKQYAFLAYIAGKYLRSARKAA